MKPRSRSPSPTLRIIAIGVVLGLLSAGKGLMDWVEVQGVGDWQTTYGEVTESRLIGSRKAQVIYRYKHPKYRNLEPFYSCGIMPGQPTIRISGTAFGRSSALESCRNRAMEFDDPAEAQALVERYPAGAVVQVFFGDYPLLEAEPHGAPWTKWIAGGLGFALLCILALALLGRTVPKGGG